MPRSTRGLRPNERSVSPPSPTTAPHHISRVQAEPASCSGERGVASPAMRYPTAPNRAMVPTSESAVSVALQVSPTVQPPG